MTEVILKGVLGKRFGESWVLQVQSVTEIFEAIEANTSKISKYFKDLQEFASHFIVFVNGKLMPTYLVNSKILKNGDKVEIVPVVQGGGWTAVFVIGLLLTVAAQIITKMMSPKAPKDVQTSSTVLGSIRNVLNRNIVVPIGYGRLMVGSAVVSNFSTSKKLEPLTASQDAGQYYTIPPYQTKVVDEFDSNEIFEQ